ncbi:MAG: TIGR00730 family Rossman fold protein [Planctomycetes bacterium]|nr:TIGR00730 family Rossman fold protein [Planctomycetota bacterium]
MPIESRLDDFTREDPWRVFRIMAEFVDGFELMARVPRPRVAVWGSARTAPGSLHYEQARRLARRLAEEGYAIVTGGGPGIMEAANRGAAEANGHSVGLNILLPFEQAANTYATYRMEFRYFFSRRVMFVKESSGIVVMPGGIGTLDEFFEVLTLKQTGKIESLPIVLFSASYWGGLLTWMRNTLLADGMISESDLSLFEVADDVEEVVKLLARGKAREKQPQQSGLGLARKPAEQLENLGLR